MTLDVFSCDRSRPDKQVPRFVSVRSKRIDRSLKILVFEAIEKKKNLIYPKAADF